MSGETELKAVKISALEAVSKINDTDLFVLEQSNTAKKLSGKQLLEFSKGATGPQGTAGPAGPTGADGFSPIVETTAIEGGHKVTVTDARGPHSFNVLDGVDGHDGKQGPEGPAGIDGATGPQGEQGIQGPQGEIGPPFLIYKVYPTVDDMNADYSNSELAEGQIVGISSETGGDNGGKLYIKGASSWEFFFDLADVDGLAGPQGQQGEQGPKGADGERGERGEKGETGEAAGFGKVTATVDSSTGEPRVKVSTSGPDTAKNFSFAFSGIKGEPGPKGEGADINFGDTLVDNDGAINVKTPVERVITQNEFDSLPEDKKNHGLYVIPGDDMSEDFGSPTKIVINGQKVECGSRGPSGPDGNPIGTIISYMGPASPTDYLACDGAIYNISDYPDLANFFEDRFGDKAYFGSHGEGTFAVPDMRNLFLRGYHGKADEQLSGEIGKKQEGTVFPYIMSDASAFGVMPNNLPKYMDSTNPKEILKQPEVFYTNQFGQTNVEFYKEYTSRPVNMAVLYCIKAVKTESIVNSTYDIGHGLELDETGTILSVKTWNSEDQDDTLPISAAKVLSIVGNIEKLLQEI